MTHYQREDWQDPKNPITGPKPKAKRTTGVLHYSASDSIPGDKAAWLRSMQNDYTKNRGYSLGYGYLVCGNGDSYEIRGNDFNMASNPGDKVDGNANDWTLSILLDVTTTSPATAAAIARCQQIFAAAGIFTRPVPHSFYDYTSCCGDTVRQQINEGLFDQSSTPDPIPVPPGDTDMASTKLVLCDVRGTKPAYLCDGNTKTWISDGNAMQQILMRLDESKGGTVPSPVDGFVYKRLDHGGDDVIVSYGPIVGAIPPGFDKYGRKT